MSERFLSGFAAFVLLAGVVFAAPGMAQSGAQSAADNADVKTYQDWQVRCPKDRSNGGCEMTQLVNNPDNGKPILRVVMGYPPEIQTAAMIFILPLGTRLAPGVQLTVDGGKPNTFPFQICLEQGCRADFPVEDGLRNRLRSGSNATVSLIGPRGERIDLKVSLQGFTDADNAIRGG
ncbi:invasion associated locus B family protein [Salinisphaera sp. T31B1]|uniref:invasion associated locus B family protein n=1 Tax=Salinisphaera sp. T31B1 TaxID=727963 RepID=UPI00333E4425